MKLGIHKNTDMFSTVRYRGKIWRVQKQMYESEEQAKDRAWFIAKELPESMDPIEKESRSRMWANEKYFGMKYETKV